MLLMEKMNILSKKFWIGNLGVCLFVLMLPVVAMAQNVADPVIKPKSGTFNESVRVKMGTTTPGANIYYSTDGREPDMTSWKYTRPFVLNSSAMVKARAYKEGLLPSNVIVSQITIDRNGGRNGGGGNGCGSGNGGGGRNCNGASAGSVPINDLVVNRDKDFQGWLYPDGKDETSDDYLQVGQEWAMDCSSEECLAQMTKAAILTTEKATEEMACRDGNCAGTTETTQGRYLTEIFKKVKVTKNIPYSQSINYAGKLETHLMDVYEPESDSAEKRPVIIWVHGGGFIEGGKGKATKSMVDYAASFARRGYVTASINYRTVPGGLIGSGMDKQVRLEAQYDAEAAVRWFRQDAATNNQYRIDTERMAMGGSSAGAATSLLVGYNYDGEPRLDDNTSNSPGLYSSQIGAVIDISGFAEPEMMLAGDPSLIIFHGTSDPIVPYLAASMLAQRANSLGIPNELNTFTGAGHNLYSKYRSTIINKIAEFLYQHLILK